MNDPTWMCDPYRTDCTYVSTSTQLSQSGLQILSEINTLGFQIITRAIALAFQIHALVTPPGLAILTELIAYTIKNQSGDFEKGLQILIELIPTGIPIIIATPPLFFKSMHERFHLALRSLPT